ncbi:hypothetical protein SeMB42_g04057 [Synchytrium endobioticum]|uniref:Chromo domain-containing protein n=1 Tax=Synchytrium endobioticum TaxID=286115 RepID=A0A507D206_9FUNG|nr:hypothetical protein SeMB42_g04057 [Synchytrium endobioticum]
MAKTPGTVVGDIEVEHESQVPHDYVDESAVLRHVSQFEAPITVKASTSSQSVPKQLITTVTAIASHRKDGANYRYNVKWSNNTESETTVKHIPQSVLRQYWKHAEIADEEKPARYRLSKSRKNKGKKKQ